MKRLIPVLGLLLAAGPADYAVRLPLTLAGDAPVQRVVLPAAALVASRSADLADVRVFDARGRAVPIARARPPLAGTRRMVLSALPILGAAGALTVTGVSLRVDPDGRARVAEVDGTVAERGGSTLLGVLLEPRSQGEAVALQLDADLPASQPLTLTVEASEDLASWRRIGRRTVYRAAGAGGGETIALDGRLERATRLRVTWAAESRLLAPVTIRGAALVTRDEPVAGTEIEAVPPPGDPRMLSFAVPFATPVASVAVIPPADDPAVPIRILGRDDREQPWVLLGQGLAGPTVPPIALGGRAVRTMRIEVDARAPGFSAAPTLRFGFAPAAIAVAASGSRPFTLAVGREGESDPYLPLAGLGAREPLPLATVSAPATRLQLAAIGDDGASRRQLLLWGVLLAATALLGGMAWLLWRRSES